MKVEYISDSVLYQFFSQDTCIWYDGPGWYFIDEAGVYLGAYKTKEDCIEGYKRHVEILNGGKDDA